MGSISPFSKDSTTPLSELMVLGADDHGLEPGQLRGQHDQMAKMILLVDDQRRQFAQ